MRFLQRLAAVFILAGLTCAYSAAHETGQSTAVAPFCPSYSAPTFVSLGASLTDPVWSDSCEFVYSTTPAQSALQIFNAQTQAFESAVAVGTTPSSVDVTADGATAYVTNMGGQDISVVDLSIRTELRKISVPPNYNNDTPHEIAIANNELALFTTTWPGSGDGARMMELNLATDAVTFRPDFWQVSDETLIEASPDDSRIAFVEGNSSTGEVYYYSAATNAFSSVKSIPTFLFDIAAGSSGTRFLVSEAYFGGDAFALDSNLNLVGTIDGYQPHTGVAVDPQGARGYRSRDGIIDIIDLTVGKWAGGIPVEGLQAGRMGISPDGTLLAVAASDGIWIVPTAGGNFEVNTISNTTDAAIGDGVCNDGAGFCSIRAAIQEANAWPGKNKIHFNIPGAGGHTIGLTSPLPVISDPVEILGTTQPGYTGNPLIELNGANAGNTASGLVITAGDSVVRGLVINRFGPINSGVGIRLETGGANLIEGNYVGTNLAGTAILGNGVGVVVTNSHNNVIGGPGSDGQRNVVSGNVTNGITITAGSQNTVVKGNYVGTDVTGAIDLGNSSGIHVNNGPNTRIGGAEPGEGNLISGNFNGLLIWNASAGSVVQGNRVGTNADASAGVANQKGVSITAIGSITVGGSAPGARNVISGNVEDGLIIDNAGQVTVQGNYIGPNAAGDALVGNGSYGVKLMTGGHRIGGTGAGEGNLISGNGSGGVRMEGSGGSVVLGNLIGTNRSGTGAITNGVGVSIYGSNNIVGGAVPAARNIISGNGTGVSIHINGSTGNRVLGNYIGTDVSGSGAVANASHGVFIDFYASGNAVGGPIAGEGNVIAFNNGDGVRIGNGASNNTIRRNIIHTNFGKGIENVNGPGSELAPPVVTAAGSASGTACANCTIDVFSDAINEGRVLHATVIADGGGTWNYPGAVIGPYVTATATNAAGNSSEFSAPFACSDNEGDSICDSGDVDDDNDNVYDLAEVNCGGDPLITSIRPERTDGVFGGVSDDGDGEIDEALPPGAEAYDCDGDGYIGSSEAHVTTSDQDPCGAGGWPSDLVPGGIQPNTLTIQDLGSFIVPIRRFGTSNGDPNFNVKWDLEPGSSVGADINLQDIAKITTGATGFPPMLTGQRAYGQSCPWPP